MSSLTFNTFPLLTNLPFDLKTIHLMDSVSTVPPSVAYRIMSTLPKQLPITMPQLPPETLLKSSGSCTDCSHYLN